MTEQKWQEYCNRVRKLEKRVEKLEQEPMRDATPEERESVDKYVKSISKPTGVNFWDLEQKPSGDLISRQAILDLIEHYNSDGLGSVFYGYEEGVKFANAVNNLPSVNSQEPKIGHWIDCSNGWMCSECHRDNTYDTDYCPNCGCAMKGELE